VSADEEAGSHRLGEADKARYSVDQLGECVVVTAAGEVDGQTAPALYDALEVAAQFSGKVVLDLGQVTVLDAPGLDVLASAREQLRDRKGSVVLVVADGQVRAILQRAGLPEAFLVVERIAEAVAALTGMRKEP
jgi:anti-sigma B factor antagonist